MTAHLLVISIGPVQDFIAAGRKTRDLWFGSFVLGEVSRQVAKAILQPGVVLIFPDESAVKAQMPVANKILAWVEPGIDPRALTAVARHKAQVQLAWCRRQALRSLRPYALRGVDVPLLNDQLANFLEFAAAWYPVDEGSYQPSREEVELLLAGRKALRDFAPAHGRDGVPKSSLDPARESVIVWPNNATDVERLRRELRLKGTEQLDGVSLIKRLAKPRRFVSVARISIDPFIRRAHRERPAELAALAEQAREMVASRHPSVESFEDKLGDGLMQYAAFPFDTQLFFDDDQSDPELRDGLQSERDQARAFFQNADALRRSLDIPEMPAYFAILKADGDYMGRAISAIDDRGDHQTLSRHLAGFAAKADEIVQECHGAMVYSGGDDVLAFLPLDRALECAELLRHAFAEKMKDVTGQTPVSLSVGVAIGHYGEHLQRLLDWGREAERAAKAPRDPSQPVKSARNALAVILHTRGAGAGRTVVHGWSEDLVPKRWNRWVQWHRCDLIPDSAAYELSRIEREFRALWPNPAAPTTDGPGSAEERQDRRGDLLRREVVRVLGRRRAQHGETPLDDTRQEDLAALIGQDLDALRRLADELLIARRIAAVTDVAEGSLDAKACGRSAKSEGEDDD